MFSSSLGFFLKRFRKTERTSSIKKMKVTIKPIISIVTILYVVIIMTSK